MVEVVRLQVREDGTIVRAEVHERHPREIGNGPDGQPGSRRRNYRADPVLLGEPAVRFDRLRGALLHVHGDELYRPAGQAAGVVRLGHAEVGAPDRIRPVAGVSGAQVRENPDSDRRRLTNRPG